MHREVAEVVKVERHPNADKLKLVTLNWWRYPSWSSPVRGINVGDAGQKVILGLRHAYFDGHVSQKQIKEIRPGNLRGIESDTMVMSNFEKIADDHEGYRAEPDARWGRLADYGRRGAGNGRTTEHGRCLGLIGVALVAAIRLNCQAAGPVVPAHWVDRGPGEGVH